MCFFPEPEPGCGFDVVVVVVGVVVVGVVEPEPVVTPPAGVVAETVGVVLVGATQLAEISVSPGGTRDAGGVPGAALTVSVVVPPVGSPTVSVHVSAEALGIAATAIVARTALTVMASVFSLRLFDTLL